MKRLIFFVLMIFGIGAFFWGFNAYRKAQASKNWPTTNGEILSSEVESFLSRSGTGSSRRSTRTYKPKVLYEYSVDGRRYTSSRIAFVTASSSDRSEAQRIVDKYAPKKKVIVYYDPESPDVVVLEPGETGGIYILFIIGGGAILLGFLVLISKRSR